MQEQADYHQRKGKNRLAEEQARNRKKDAQIEGLRDSEFNHKAQRHLKLKESITRIKNGLDSENEKRRKKMAAQLAAQEKEKKELMAAGLNPYEVFRRRELEEKQEEIKIKASALKQMRQEQMLEKIMAEDVRLREDEAVVEEARQAAAAFQREMNGVERRRKMMNYITQQTVGHVDVLDPTGKAMRIDPSKVTVQKTMDFGLGRARPELLAKMDKKLEQQALDLHQGADQEQDDEWDIMGEDAQHEDQGEESDTTGGKIWEMKLTKLEQQYMAEARQRQKENIVTVQKCWGREFSGQAFLANPVVIAFTDFEVGQRYKKVIKLTNVSLTFNQFKLLPLDDMISDFFEIEFQPPGRMSAGTTCTVTLLFTPKKNRDIYTSFNILSQTGPIAFPLQATTRKTILTITPQDNSGKKLVDFGDVLRGEYKDRTLTIANSGALPSNWQLDMPLEGAFIQMP